MYPVTLLYILDGGGGLVPSDLDTSEHHIGRISWGQRREGLGGDNAEGSGFSFPLQVDDERAIVRRVNRSVGGVHIGV